MDLYLRVAYPPNAGSGAGSVPAAVAGRMRALEGMPEHAAVPLEFLERDDPTSGCSYALRLGQPLYPHMKLVLDPIPESAAAALHKRCQGYDFLLRVDAHDRHLHAAPGSPDAAWLAGIRQSNKEIGERIEADWAAAGLPTFKEFLREQLAARRQRTEG